MIVPNAMTGWLWVKQGLSLFRRQPAEVLTLFFSYMFLNMGIGLLPVLGQVLPLILIPVFSMSFMQACRQIDLGERVYPNLLLFGFRSPAFVRLLMLGVLYLIAATLAISISRLFDGGAFWNFVTNQKPIGSDETPESGLLFGMLVSGLVYLPALMGFWFAAPLIAWKQMSLPKALFYSYFSVFRAGKAFLVYGFAWMMIGIVLPTIISLIIAVIVGKATIVVLAMMPVSAILTAVMYCSFFPIYLQIFGKPDVEDQPS
ncbi:MAG: hypothetical protein KGM99_05415 [Burkholderiales bacterium]|nr:hypothetical protein [Burkholderiales bacterium]